MSGGAQEGWEQGIDVTGSVLQEDLWAGWWGTDCGVGWGTRKSVKESGPTDLTRRWEDQACNRPGSRGALQGTERVQGRLWGRNCWIGIAAGMSESSCFQSLKPSARGPSTREGGSASGPGKLGALDSQSDLTVCEAGKWGVSPAG